MKKTLILIMIIAGMLLLVSCNGDEEIKTMNYGEESYNVSGIVIDLNPDELVIEGYIDGEMLNRELTVERTVDMNVAIKDLVFLSVDSIEGTLKPSRAVVENYGSPDYLKALTTHCYNFLTEDEKETITSDTAAFNILASEAMVIETDLGIVSTSELDVLDITFYTDDMDTKGPITFIFDKMDFTYYGRAKRAE